jgi:hypothetical protein
MSLAGVFASMDVMADTADFVDFRAVSSVFGFLHFRNYLKPSSWVLACGF